MLKSKDYRKSIGKYKNNIMIKEDILTKNEILDLQLKNPRMYVKIIKNEYPNTLKKINDYCINLDIDNLSQKIYHYVYKLTEKPKCICGNDVKFMNNIKNWGYKKYCSVKCSAKNRENKKCYVKNWYNKKKEEVLNNDIKIYSKKDTIVKIKEFINFNEINIPNFSIKLLSIDEQLWKSFILHYGNFTSEKLYLLYNNLIEKPKCIICGKNCKFINFNKGYKEFCSTECSIKYKYIDIKKNSYERIKNLCKENNLTLLTPIEKYIDNKSLLFMCDKGHEFKRTLSNFYKSQSCPICFNGKSKYESEIYEFLSDNITSFISLNNRSILDYNLELDFYIPNNNLAIEYNGNYYHCDSHERITYKYHLDKTERCLKQNIQLLHIFEHQWNDYFKRDIWKSILSGKLGKNNVIFGRKCKIVNINNKEKNNFLNKNHLQGTCNSSIDLGLIYSNELVAVMTFGKPRFNKNSEWELLRFCNKKFHTVIGGASKLFKYFIKKYKGNIVTYADRTYSNGGLYNKLGFDLIKTNSPSYFYFKNNEIISRYKSQKSKLGKLLENYNSDLTEYQNMLENGYHRVWDCGTLVFKYKN